MEDFKIELFKKEYESEFPKFKHLNIEDSRFIEDRIIEKFNIINRKNLIDELCEKQSWIENFNVDENFELLNFLNSYSIDFDDEIYINWYKFDNIDKIKIIDLNNYFYDIWYPSADDIDLFDENLNWILTIRHDGSVSLVRFS